jgi:hypothetical protein
MLFSEKLVHCNFVDPQFTAKGLRGLFSNLAMSWMLRIGALKSRYPFVNQAFNVPIHLIDQATQVLKCGCVFFFSSYTLCSNSLVRRSSFKFNYIPKALMVSLLRQEMVSWSVTCPPSLLTLLNRKLGFEIR